MTNRAAMARLMAALLALAFSMATPITAAQAMMRQVVVTASPAAMPCHEAAETSEQMTMSADTRAGIGHGERSARLHLCCVLSCLMVPPLAMVDFAVPVASALPVTAGATPRLDGATPGLLDPPPRLS